MADIFLSYAREDESRARLVAAALERRGWSVWWDRRIPHGKDFNVYIQQQLDDARCIVVLWSEASVVSPFVRDEATEGTRNNRLVPALIEGVRLPLGFRQLQVADLCDWQDQATHDEFERLVGSIGAMVPQLQEIPDVVPAHTPSTTPAATEIVIGADVETPTRRPRARRREKARAAPENEAIGEPLSPPLSSAVSSSVSEGSRDALGSGPVRDLLIAVGGTALAAVTTWTVATRGPGSLELDSDRLVVHNALITAIVAGSWALVRRRAHPVLVILPVMLSLVLTRGLAILQGSFTLVGLNAILANDALVVVGSLLTILGATVFAGSDTESQSAGTEPDRPGENPAVGAPDPVLAPSSAVDPAWQCGSCGEVSETKFDACWSCGTARPV